MSKYKYEGYGVIRDTEIDFPYHTDDIVELLDEKDQNIADLEAKIAESEKLTERLQQIVDKLRDKEFAGKTLVEAVNAVYEPLYKNKYDEAEELKKQLEEKEKDNQFFKKMYLSEKQKNDNYHTEKYALDKPVEELRKIKLTPKEKEIYYKGFDNCERQFATHIAELEQQLQSQPAEIVEKINGEIYTRMVVECKKTKYTDINLILNTILKEYQQ